MNQGRHIPTIEKEPVEQPTTLKWMPPYMPPAPPITQNRVPLPTLDTHIAILLQELDLEDNALPIPEPEIPLLDVQNQFVFPVHDIPAVKHSPSSAGPAHPVTKDVLPRSFYHVKKSTNWHEWKRDMDIQLQKLEAAGTWERVALPTGARAVPCKWVFAMKDGTKVVEALEKNDTLYTARLVARGDLQQKGFDYNETFAPVVKLVSLRVILTYAAMMKVELAHWDVVAAFLNGDLKEVVYMRQPPGYYDGTGSVLLLKKSIYGLYQSARCFYQYIDQLLSKIGWRRLHCEWAIWISPCHKAFIGSHVDDFIVAASPSFRDELRKYLDNHLTITDLGELSIYVGIEIQRKDDKIGLHQADYIDEILERFKMTECNGVGTPMLEIDRDRVVSSHSEKLATDDKKRYQQLIGCLLYLMHCTRPDLAYAVIRLSHFSSCPEKHHWEAAKRILRYLKATKHAILELGRFSDVFLQGFFDSAHADNKDKRSTGGYVCLLYGSLISWQSKVQKVVALSSTEAEYTAATEAGRELIWIQGLLEDMGLSKSSTTPTILYGDNMGSNALTRNPEFH